MRLAATVTTLAIAAAIATGARGEPAAQATRDSARRAPDGARADDPDGVVVVNAMGESGDAGQVARLRRALAARGLLVEVPEPIALALEGRSKPTVDVEPIKEAYVEFDYARAARLIEAQEGEVLDETAAGDPTTALAELALWRGLLAAAQDQEEDAVRWFRGAYRLNSALRIDPELAAPSVRQLIKRARHEAEETGALRIDADPPTARLSIDGGPPRDLDRELDLEAGLHLVVISAPRRTPYAEMVEVRAGRVERLEIKLDPENDVHAAARLVDQTAATPPGKQRLRRARALSRITGAKRVLVVEDGSDDHVTLRLYDVSAKRVSKQFDLSGTASTTSIARMVRAALDGEDELAGPGPRPRSRWFTRWYVWAAVGAVAVGAGVLTYQYLGREPELIRGP